MTNPGSNGTVRGDYSLVLDASTYRGTVAILDGARVLAEREVAMKGADAERLMPAVADALVEAGVGVEALARVICGEGPGSFTSLRIAGAIAKGIASARDIPLFAVSSLWLIAAAAEPPLDEGAWLCVSDAMRGECYATDIYVTEHGVLVHETSTRLSRAGDFDAERAHEKRIVGPNVAGVDREVWPHARGVARDLAWVTMHPPVDLDRWEPSYGRLAEAQVKWEAAHGRPLAQA